MKAENYVSKSYLKHWFDYLNILIRDLHTLESGINVAPWINIAPGKFGKKNKRSPIYTLYLYY